MLTRTPAATHTPASPAPAPQPTSSSMSSMPSPGPGLGERVRLLAPGLGLAAGVAVLSLVLSRLVPGMSALLVAIVVGVIVGNLPSLPASTAPGLAVASQRLLRIGIVLLGLSVSVAQITALGAGVVAVAVAVVAGGFLVAEVVGRILGVSPSQRILIGAGMSICGAAAVAAVEPVAREHARARARTVGSARAGDGAGRDVEREVDEQVVTAVALVVALGTLMIGVVPLASSALGLDERTAGLWAGASIHEVAQVVATGGLIGGAALQAAVVVKLTRVLLLAPVVALLGLQARRAHTAGAGVGSTSGSSSGMAAGRVARPPLVPLFVIGFLVAVGVRSLDVLPASALAVFGSAQTLLFAAAMFALGCGVRPATLRAVGGRPVVLAVLTTLAVVGIGLGGVLLVA